MSAKISDIMDAGFIAFVKSPDWKAKAEARKSQQDADALKYLRAKFPELDEKIFFTSYTGAVCEHVIDAPSVCQAQQIDNICTNCKGGLCGLPENFKNGGSRPVISVKENPKGFKFLTVGWACDMVCKYKPLSGEFGRMFAKSGLTPEQLGHTFENYERRNNNFEIITAKAQAVMAAEEKSCLILAGKRGTGKTHLAIAIAIDAMKHGRQAIFRLVSELIDELRDANIDTGDKYTELMKIYKEVPCLILDDMGKERTTKAGVDYIYQIVDYRYRRNLQTIVTTNAPNEETLCLWGEEQYVAPMISRLEERGVWVTIQHAEDFRLKKHARGVNSNAK